MTKHHFKYNIKESNLKMNNKLLFVSLTYNIITMYYIYNVKVKFN